MAREDVEFKTQDGLCLRGWFYRPTGSSRDSKLPCIVMCHGFGALKEMGISPFAEKFTSFLPVCALLYDNRNFGASEGTPRNEVIPAQQCSDYSDAITYAQSRPEVDPRSVAIWGTSFSGAHVLNVAAVDRRVKAVVSQVMVADGWENFHRLVRNDLVKDMEVLFEQDRLARARGEAPMTLPTASPTPDKELCVLPTPDSWEYASIWMKKIPQLENRVTVRSVEAFRAHSASAYIHHISPTPLLMVVADKDELTPTDIAIEAYTRAREPKQFYLFSGGHYTGYEGEAFEEIVAVEIAFWKKWLKI